MIRTLLRRIAIAFGGLVALVLVALTALYFATQRRIDEHLTVAGHALTVPGDSAGIEHGRRIINSYGMCADCHGPDLGGQVFLNVPVVAQLYAANLTSGEGGLGGTLADLDWERAIRHGVAPDGRKLLFMPAHEYSKLHDEDMAAVIAYLKQLPKVSRPMVTNHVGPVGRALYLKGDLELLPAELMDHTAAHPAVIAPAPTMEYGRYLSTTCVGCHGKTLSGGPIPGTPPEFRPPANITPKGIGHYTEAEFFAALREGKRAGGTMLDTVYMPVRFTRNLSDDQLKALYVFLKTVAPKEYGGR